MDPISNAADATKASTAQTKGALPAWARYSLMICGRSLIWTHSRVVSLVVESKAINSLSTRMFASGSFSSLVIDNRGSSGTTIFLGEENFSSNNCISLSRSPCSLIRLNRARNRAGILEANRSFLRYYYVGLCSVWPSCPETDATAQIFTNRWRFAQGPLVLIPLSETYPNKRICTYYFAQNKSFSHLVTRTLQTNTDPKCFLFCNLANYCLC